MFRGMLNFWRKDRNSAEKAPFSHLREKEAMQPNKDLEKQLQLWIGSIRFSRKQLQTATRNFSRRRLIVEDNNKTGYAGNLQGKRVAVFRFHPIGDDKEKLFLSEVHALSMLQHQNIVKGIGWCREGGEIFIVHEAMENGTLYDHLHLTNKDPLPWDVRFKIAIDLAAAILYMHEQCEHCILHRDIKSRNVLLDSDFNAKLTSFELAKIIDQQAEDAETRVMGTVGYIDPQYMSMGVLTRSSDVYSFGVVALEIATGRKAVDFQSTGSQTLLVEEVRRLYVEEEISAVADERLSGEFDPAQMKQLLTVGLRCTRADGRTRPSIQQVEQFLKFGVALPNIEMDVPMYSSSPKSLVSLTLDIEARLFDSGNGKHKMYQSEIDEISISAGETYDKIEKAVPDDESNLTREAFDIGIPSGYTFSCKTNLVESGTTSSGAAC